MGKSVAQMASEMTLSSYQQASPPVPPPTYAGQVKEGPLIYEATSLQVDLLCCASVQKGG